LLSLPVGEFLSRFLLRTCFRKASCVSGTSASWPADDTLSSSRFAFSSWERHNNRLTKEHTSSTGDSPDLYRCPDCGGPMKVIERLTAAEIQLRSPPRISAAA